MVPSGPYVEMSAPLAIALHMSAPPLPPSNESSPRTQFAPEYGPAGSQLKLVFVGCQHWHLTTGLSYELLMTGSFSQIALMQKTQPAEWQRSTAEVRPHVDLSPGVILYGSGGGGWHVFVMALLSMVHSWPVGQQLEHSGTAPCASQLSP
jgi:hypothetical protein